MLSAKKNTTDNHIFSVIHFVLLLVQSDLLIFIICLKLTHKSATISINLIWFFFYFFFTFSNSPLYSSISFINTSLSVFITMLYFFYFSFLLFLGFSFVNRSAVYFSYSSNKNSIRLASLVNGCGL